LSLSVDLHTHSYGSSDGALKLRDYRYFIQNELLDYIAITDHDRIDIAQKIKQELGELGDHIIVGEEITTSDGEVIGLYLKERVKPGQTAAETVHAIHAQGGLVYVPHPFETARKGLQAPALTAIMNEVDIVETYNGRALLQNRSHPARHWAGEHELPGAASSDAHGRFGWGYTYSIIDTAPTVGNLVQLLHAAEYSTRTVGMGIMYPKFNRLRKKLTR
jgi:predicted metal-dependent phosphoesterase TrpH